MKDMNRQSKIRVRAIEPRDNEAVANIIRRVMTEFGAVGCNFSIADEEVDAMGCHELTSPRPPVGAP